jgi:hypothetical protein
LIAVVVLTTCTLLDGTVGVGVGGGIRGLSEIAMDNTGRRSAGGWRGIASLQVSKGISFHRSYRSKKKRITPDGAEDLIGCNGTLLLALAIQ